MRMKRRAAGTRRRRHPFLVELHPSGIGFERSPPRLLALAIGMGILGWAYWPNLEELFAVWTEEPNYSHGFLVLPIALAIFWQRLKDNISTGMPAGFLGGAGSHWQ